jgi:GLPGLI family protein
MKKIILLFTFISSINSFGQLKKGIIYYGYIEALANGDANGPDSNAYMVFNKEQSYYVTAKDSLEKDEQKYGQKIYTDKNGKGGAIDVDGMKVSKHGDQVVYNIKKNTMWSSLLYRQQIYVKEVCPKMNWKIEKETKKIGSLLCKKATTTFRGRTYTAWFAPDIALPYGPWKLNGLPGLIVEAYDTDKYVFWYFKNMEYPTTNKANVKYLSIPKGSTFKTYEEFKKIQKEEQNKTIDKQRIVQKQFPNVIFVNPKISEMFIEIE